MKLRDLTIAIPTRNRETDLQRSLLHMRDAGLDDVHFIIYDDASDDPQGTVRAASVLKNCEIILGDHWVGQAAGRNCLLKACKTAYCLFMDDDTWFQKMDSLGNVLANRLTYEGIGRATAVCFQVVRTYDEEHLFPVNMGIMRILKFTAMGLLINREEILQIGGFLDFFVYRHEETEMALRLWRNNLLVVYDPSVVVEHFHTPAARNSFQYDYLSARNLILMHGLNLPGLYGTPSGVLRAVKLVTVAGTNKLAIIRGIGDGIRDLRHYKNHKKVMSRSQYNSLCKFNRELDEIFRGSH